LNGSPGPCKGRLTFGYARAVAVSVPAKTKVNGRALCAHVSSETAEPLAATASRVDHWILVEYRGAWDREVLGGSLLSAELKAHLRGELAALPRARLLFVKKPERRAHRRRQLFFGCSRPGRERFFALEFERHDDLVGLELAAALAGGGTVAEPLEHPLFVVCTHGKRDPCCAKFGRPLYDALRHETDSDWVWQSTHVGGDRFAGNVVAFPHGVYYGRVGPRDVSALLDEHAAGRLWLERYRGRSAYSFAVQAAEYSVRVEEDLRRLDDLTVLACRATRDGWRVRLRDPAGAVHEVDVVEERGEEAVHLTCGSALPQHARRYVATGRRVKRR
jgi:hypothetical protein